MLVEFLHSLHGIEVVGTATDGEEALAMMSRLPADLVLMDINMPLLDGLQATRRIREEHPATRVILMTMSFTSAIKARALKAGADAFISKEEIHEALTQAIVRLFPGSDPLKPPLPSPGAS
jgi:DNA-binding NarL/FixJ family response regulator